MTYDEATTKYDGAASRDWSSGLWGEREPELHCKGVLSSSLNDPKNSRRTIKYRAASTSQMSDLSEFANLDQLIQVIYIGSSRFVLLSTVDKAYKYWDIHACITGNSVKWWRGRWTLSDINNVTV
jgi:hypothetical protein